MTLPTVTGRAQTAFDVERVTKRFYERFRVEHSAFLKLIEGIPDGDMQRWYESVMINRLMFNYFIQRKGFLNADHNYLRTNLAETQRMGKDHYYSGFLCPLFFEGLAKREEERFAAINKLLGKVPYLDGGLFHRHQIEELYGKKVQIADAAFQRLFQFFEQYQWHLDERPNRRDDEIAPDVLGYIFEKYINQKQMGAYYTKEDITGYIAKSTIIPFLFDAARKDCAVAFRPGGAIWFLLKEDPDRYIYEAMKKGKDLELPPEIAAGINDVSKRTCWNRPAPSEYALPTEIWREVVSRRRRYEEVRSKLAAGEVQSINDLITLNLDIRQFAEDVIENCEGPELLRAFFHAIERVSVLDPTCGSGAFLFAALGILEPLYDACLDRMQIFLDDLERSGQKHRPEKFSDFRKILDSAAAHPNRKYFILKSIVVNNLFGVDIMEEAVEICKLRLFLKLVAQVDCVEQIEPLPDIDFNIRAGNTLVGYATYEDVKAAVGGQQRLAFDDALQRIEEKADDIDRLFERFREQQTEFGGKVTVEDKLLPRSRLAELEEELNWYLAGEYGVKKAGYKEWLAAHRPFHWFIDFHAIMRNGGFDVIIGNPPWREYAAVKKEYTIRGFQTEACGNLHGICTERALSLRSTAGQLSFIVQLPLVSSSRMATVRRVLIGGSDRLLVIPFDDRPGRLFDGLEHCRAAIFVSAGKRKISEPTLITSRYQRWATDARDSLLSVVEFAAHPVGLIHPGQFAKFGSDLQTHVFEEVARNSGLTVGSLVLRRPEQRFIFYQEATQYWVKATVGLPYYAKNGLVGAPPHGRYLYFDTSKAASVVCAALNSSLFYCYFIAYGDCFHLSDHLVSTFPLPKTLLCDDRIVDLCGALMADLNAKAERKTIQTSAGDEISYAEFYASASKPLINEIDNVLAQHYGFTNDELDFIINYDIKYRMGLDAADGDEE